MRGSPAWAQPLERESGAVTPHVEWFGGRGSKPALQYSARGDVGQRMQLDGTVGRSDSVAPYSVGVKYRL